MSMSIPINTKGDVKRVANTASRQMEIKQREIEQKTQQLIKRQNDKNKGLFKRTVIDSYIKVFAENYGEAFDYNSLINSISFTFKEEKDGTLSPSFSIKTNNIQFKSDAERQCQPFNENSYSDFVSNEDVINGKALSIYQFDNKEEYDAYEQGDIFYDELSDLDGEFIPISNEERFGEFNRINKLMGYMTPEDSSKIAQQNAKIAWQKIKK